VWDTRNDVLSAAFDLEQTVSSVALRRDGGEVIACGERGALRAWSVRDGSSRLASSIGAPVKCLVALTPDGAIAITGDYDGKVQAWDAATGRPLRELAPATAPSIYAIAVSPDGHRVVTGHDDNDARIWDIASGRLLATLTGHTKPIFSTTWAPDGSRLATCSNDGTAAIWDATSGTATRIQTLDSHCPGVAFDRDGDRVATASRHSARVWTRDGQLAGSYDGHQGDVTAVMFGPPGLLVTTSFDATVRVWDLATRQHVESFPHPGSVEDGDVSVDRSLLASLSGNRVYLWTLDPGVSVERTRAIVDALPLALHDGVLVRKSPPAH
jgi:WD40 repeat protein